VIPAEQCQSPESKLRYLYFCNFLLSGAISSLLHPSTGQVLTHRTHLEDGRYTPHVHDTSSKALTKAGVQGEQWDPNHQREQEKLNNEGGCNTSN
jgi:hypothetical protein